ncbi:rhomboid family intramembrane serine protease [Halobacteria archaeon AArc-curdl1]|uniref:Rhomboid family intramembrane serine protease n=1 Tax=Natronosalvus hydrolyticus TaxID=2979988 RepID=A0AAP2Z8S3_9EURY|nr:rhomboid family intramembrane serine protease [Halobacteria archaeon AArc-curdl1]
MASDSPSPLLETLGLFAIVFILQWIAALFSLAVMAGLFVLAPPLESNPWTIVTSVYAHGSLEHLLSNSIGLLVFGWPIARATTRVRFHTFFVVTGAFAGISQVLVTSALAPLTGGEATAVLGASGAVFALMGYLIAGNRLSEGFASRVDVPLWVTLVVFVILASVITIATGAPGVALVAHFTGFLVGLVAGRMGVLEVRGATRERRAAA